jgi:CubicO group peptidase (beta-lactamase class C family)
MKKKSRLLIFGVFLLILLVWAFMPKYALNALWHLEPNLDDYKIFSNNVVETGEYQAWKLHPEYNKRMLSAELVAQMEEYDPVAFLIVKDTGIFYEQYWDGYNDNSISNSFSMAKSIISLLVGAALDEGLIDSLDQRVGDFVPSFNEGEKSKISIRHLLTMSAGTYWNEAYSSLFSPTTELYYGDDLQGMVDRLISVKEPGKEYYYSSIESEVLAMVVQAATGKNISDYASEKFWIPMGAKSDALWCLDKEGGMEKAYCCFNSNARDFARWGQLVLNNGVWNGEQLISESYLNQALQPADYLVDETGEPLDYYGFQWWIINYKGYQIPYMRGILGQYIFVIKEKNAIIVRLGHKRSDELIGPNRKDIFVYLDAAFELLNEN